MPEEGCKATHWGLPASLALSWRQSGQREPLRARQIRNMVLAEGAEPWGMKIKLLAASQAAKHIRSK